MTNLKALMERREELRQNMETLVNTADTECRAMTEEETAQFDAARARFAPLMQPSSARSVLVAYPICLHRRMPRNVLPQRRAHLSIMSWAVYPSCVPVNRT